MVHAVYGSAAMPALLFIRETRDVSLEDLDQKRVAACFPCTNENAFTNMIGNDPDSLYALGSTDAEHERLIRQAALLAPLTERFFREAGISHGQCVLDLGSGAGDVAILAARFVGPSGEVVGVERDPRSIARARSRVAEAGLHNVRFTQSDISRLPANKPFDAVVGRFILMYLADPVAVLRSLFLVVRPGGLFAFHEPSCAPALAVAPQLPLWTTCVSLIRECLHRSGANLEIGLALYQIFREAGLPGPSMRMEIPLGNGPDFTRQIYDLLCSLWSRIQQLNLHSENLGDFNTLLERLQAEVAVSNTVVPFGVALVGACSRRPT